MRLWLLSLILLVLYILILVPSLTYSDAFFFTLQIFKGFTSHPTVTMWAAPRCEAANPGDTGTVEAALLHGSGGLRNFPLMITKKRPPAERHFHSFFILWVTGLLCPSHVGGTWWTAEPPCTLDPKLITLPAPRGSGRRVSRQRDLVCFGLSFHSLPLNDFH